MSQHDVFSSGADSWLQTFRKRFDGPESSEIEEGEILKDEDIAWSPCDAQGMLNLNIDVRLTASSKVTQDGSVTLDRFVAGTVWRPTHC